MAHNSAALHTAGTVEYLTLILENVFAAMLATRQSTFTALDAAFGKDALWLSGSFCGQYCVTCPFLFHFLIEYRLHALSTVITVQCLKLLIKFSLMRRLLELIMNTACNWMKCNHCRRNCGNIILITVCFSLATNVV